MKIAILEPYIEGIGGAQKVIAQYARFLLSHGHEVEIFTQRYDEKTCYEEFKGIKVNLLKPKIKPLVPLVFLFKKFIGFDLVIANDWPTHFSSFRNKDVVWVCYSPKRDFYDLKEFYIKNGGFKKKVIIFLKELLFKKIDSLCAHKARTIIPISKTIRERVKNYYGIKTKKIFYPGIYYSEFKSGSTKDYFLSVGRLVKTKRVDKIVRAMHYVNNKRIRLIIVGDGPEMNNLKEIAENNKNIVFLGAVSDKKKRELYSDAISSICVSAQDDWGLTPIESAACKIPMIGVNEGALKEIIIDKKTGFLIRNSDPKLIAEKMDYLFDNKSKAKIMGLAAYNHCKKFDWGNILPSFENWLREIVNE